MTMRTETMLAVISQARDMLEASAGTVEVEDCHWIGGADGSSYYCYDCAEKLVEAGGNEDVEALPGDELSIDGGWRGEHDSSPTCEECGCRLNYCPTTYCTQSEIEHFLDWWNDDIDPATALDLFNIFDQLEDYGDPEQYRTMSRDYEIKQLHWNLENGFTLAERTISAVVFATSKMDPGTVWNHP